MENITGKAVTQDNYLKTRLYLVSELKILAKSHSVIIEAPRRFGKTSVIKELIRQENAKQEDDKQFNIIFLELEGEETIENFCCISAGRPAVSNRCTNLFFTKNVITRYFRK